MSLGAYNPANSRVYTGLSTDTKPTAAIGDKFIATDTKTLSMYFGSATGWVELGVLGGTAALGVAAVI